MAQSEDALIEHASILIDQKRFSDAIPILKQILAIDAENAFAHYLLAFCQMQLSEQENFALDSINRALTLGGPQPSFFALRSFIKSSKGKYKEALEDAVAAISADPDYLEAYLAKAQCHMGLKEWKIAEESVRQALMINPEHALAGNLLAHCLRMQNKQQESKEYISNLLANDPQDAFSHVSAGWQALESHDLKKAEFHFREALRLNPDFEYARQGILETFKAKSPIYRLYLSYSFAMSRLQSKYQIAIIIGLFFVMRIVQSVFTGKLAPIGYVVLLAYLVFCLWSWLARGVGNFGLLFNSFARLALRKNEIIEAICVGGSLVGGLVLLVISFLVNSPGLLVGSIAILSVSFPCSLIFTNSHPFGPKLYALAALVILITGLWASFLILTSFKDANFIGALRNISNFTTIGVMWAGAFGVYRS